MKLDIFSHCAIDTICINDTNHIVPGGAACYCSLMAKTLKFDVILHTKFGPDFPLVDYLSNEKILMSDKAGATKATNNGPNIVPWLFAAPNFPIPAVLFSLEVISAT